MNFRRLVIRSLRFHWRSHVGVVLGAAVATAVLVGALVIGDSVRWSLRRMALERIGKTDLALVAPDRFFAEGLADRMAAALDTPTAPILQLRGVAAREDGTARINQVQVLGVGERFWAMGDARPPLAADAEGVVAVNKQTARRLNLRVGDGLLLRVEKPSALALDAPLASASSATLALRVTVAAVVGDEAFGRFSLAANQVPPYNIFVPAAWLQEKVDAKGMANVLLVGRRPAGGQAVQPADAALARQWRLEDAELNLRPLADDRGVDLVSSRVFLDPSVVQAAVKTDPEAVGIFTYFVNEFRIGDRTTPYSMVSAIGPLTPPVKPRRPGDDSHMIVRPGASGLLSLLPWNMQDDEMVINSWLAEDLAAKPDDTIAITYYVVGPMNRLETRSARFRIRTVVPLEGAAADRDLMPDFPGLKNIESTRQWDPGIPIDLKRIRDKDEAYWHEYRGTPKAFVTLAAGRKMWGNRFGNLTAVRFVGASETAELLGEKIRANLDPASLGLFFQPVRERALAASSQGVDFGQLFLGLSLFLVVAALVLVGLLFAFGVEQRAEEVGTLLALGLPPRRVRRMFWAEGGLLAFVGGAIGAGGGLLFTWAMIYGLRTVWSGAVASADVYFHAEPLSVAIGAAAGILVAAATIGLAVRRQARAPARELLAAGAEAELRLRPHARTWAGLAVAAVAGISAALILPLAKGARGEEAASVFFGVGALLLVALLALCHALLAVRQSSRRRLDFTALAFLNASRRRGRSLAVVTLLACGVFMIVAVGANRQGSPADVERRSSGTGGFALFGETALPVLKDLDSAEGRKAFALPDDCGAMVARIVPLRVHEGDEASCLNLNRPQNPRVVGVDQDMLSARMAFTFVEISDKMHGDDPWFLLEQPTADGAVPAIADQTTLTWSLGKKVGDAIPCTDQAGRTFQLRIVGSLAGSVLQGSLIISEDDFLAKFPSESGYRMFLIDAAPGRAAEVSKILSERLSDVGMSVTPTAERLAAFSAVENTYLAIFQSLGGLALLLGSVGMGVVVMRNVMERRGELALLRAVGFRRRALYGMVLAEHWGLLVLGLGCGVAAAAVAIMPAVRSGGADVPYGSLGLTLAAVLAAGLLWTWLAARWALRGPILAALRNE